MVKLQEYEHNGKPEGAYERNEEVKPYESNGTIAKPECFYCCFYKTLMFLRITTYPI